MEEVTGAYAAAILPPAGTHQHTPSVFGSDFVNALAGRCGIAAGFSACGNSERLDLHIISARIVLAVNHNGLTSGIYHDIIF